MKGEGERKKEYPPHPLPPCLRQVASGDQGEREK